MFRGYPFTLSELNEAIADDGPVRRKHVYLRQSDATKAAAVIRAGKSVIVGSKPFTLKSYTDVFRCGLELLYYWVYQDSWSRRKRHTNPGLDREKEQLNVYHESDWHRPIVSRCAGEGIQGYFISHPTVGCFETIEEG